MTDAAARLREANRPRSASNVSRRTFVAIGANRSRPRRLCRSSHSIARSTSNLSSAMTAFRLMSLPAHGAMELLVGLGLMASPFVLGFSAGATLVTVVVGALVAGLALGAAVAETGSIDIAA